MEEKKIELTLDTAQSAAAKAQQEAADLTAAAETAEKAELAAVDEELRNNYLKDVQLTEEETAMVEEFSQKIDVADSAAVLSYGSASQEKMTALSDTILQGVKTKDLGEVGDMIGSLVNELEGYNETETKGFLGLFKKPVNALAKMKTQYASTEANVDKITEILNGHQNSLTRDIASFDQLYADNLTYFKEITMYIIAGKKAAEDAKTGKLADLRKTAETSGLAEDAQAANDYAAAIERFEKKLHDLELTRTISMQMAPQIRLVQNNDMMMVERIQSTINNTIPLWKNQMVLAMGVADSQEAMKAQKQVNDLTNEMLKKNAETLHQGSVEIARENERAIVDAETLKITNQELINTLKEVIDIQEEGRNKRAQAENELIHIEAELKETLLDIRNGKN